MEDGDGDESKSSVSDRGRLILESHIPSDNRELSMGDSIFTADHEEDESSSSEEDEEENDLVG
jgi:hypothetical protein